MLHTARRGDSGSSPKCGRSIEPAKESFAGAKRTSAS
jgi:hypothetical protein